MLIDRLTSRRRRVGFGAAVLAALLAACQAVTGVVQPPDMTISLQNGTTKDVVLVVNGSPVRQVRPGDQVEVDAAALPALPWVAEVRLPTGRRLVGLTIRAGDVVTGAPSQKGDAARADLSCGRIDLWSGPPLLGPAPGPGTPGDCDP